VVGEAQEGEGFRTPLAALCPGHGREAAELDQARRCCQSNANLSPL
jgi:hypothetical protein